MAEAGWEVIGCCSRARTKVAIDTVAGYDHTGSIIDLRMMTRC